MWMLAEGCREAFRIPYTSLIETPANGRSLGNTMVSPKSDAEQSAHSIVQKLFSSVVLFSILAWVTTVGVIDLGSVPNWIHCPFNSMTGYLCPGCGSTRATHYLLHGQLLMSLRYNPLLILLGIPAVFFIVRANIAVLRNKTVKPFRPMVKTGFLILFLLLAFWFLRNIPLALFDILRPPQVVQIESATDTNGETGSPLIP
jgi:uncharacterized protein DUF2752